MSRFKKTNNSRFLDSLICEAEGLALLQQTLSALNYSFIKTPKVYEVSNNQLILEKIYSKMASQQQWYRFGQCLAQLHKVEQAQYGFGKDNYIGLNPQKNILTDNWGKFFFEYRLMYQIDSIEKPEIRAKYSEILNSKKSNLIELLNKNCQHPSLVHGDLWSGNLMFDSNNAWLIDPAVYYGDREVDIAMTEMFGGFASEFYEGYDSIYARSEEYYKKKQIYNLYHYLNHYNLFGDGYLASCKKSLGEIASNL